MFAKAHKCYTTASKMNKWVGNLVNVKKKFDFDPEIRELASTRHQETEPKKKNNKQDTNG